MKEVALGWLTEQRANCRRGAWGFFKRACGFGFSDIHSSWNVSRTANYLIGYEKMIREARKEVRWGAALLVRKAR
jgi:hypothetical protein